MEKDVNHFCDMDSSYPYFMAMSSYNLVVILQEDTGLIISDATGRHKYDRTRVFKYGSTK